MPVAPTSSASTPKLTPQRKPAILVVDDEPAMLELSGDILARRADVRVLQAASIAEARRILARESVALLVVDVRLPDGDGTRLIAELKDQQPDAAAMVITGHPTLEQSVACFRDGAADYLPKPFTADEFSKRVGRALQMQRERARVSRRMSRLRSAVRKLNGARRMVSKKVDLLCNDLVGAYGDLARQFEEVRVKENFRRTVAEAADLEQMLCHTMDWLLRQCGYANIAIHLSNEDGTYDLGAYMKFTIVGSKELTEAMKTGVVEQVSREDFVQWTDAEAAAAMSPTELDVIRGHGVMGVNASYLGESLATIVLFRDGKSPFTAEDAATLRGIAPIFAQVLTSLARSESDEDDDEVDDASDALDELSDDAAPRKRKPADDQPRKKKQDDADWWKRGDAPPY